MSRVAKNPVVVPSGVEVGIDGAVVRVKGGKGELRHSLPAGITVERDGDALKVKALTESRAVQALAGTTRAQLQNMVRGVTEGFQRKLEIVGVGYRAQVQGKVLNLALGFSHPVQVPIPDGITIETPSQTEIIVRGVDRRSVGQLAADIRAFRPPEPYKGKGVRYAGEHIIRKEAKKA
jgi:large subunit ribosomal protein L6